MTKSRVSGRAVLLGGVALGGMLGVTLLSVGDAGWSGVAVAEARGGGGGNGPDGRGGQGHGWSDGPGGHDFGGGSGNRGGWSDGGGRRGGDGGRGTGAPEASARATSTEPPEVTDTAPPGDDAAAAALHGDGSGRLRLIELFGAAATSPPPGIDTTPAGPDLTHQEERALIAEGWRGTP